MVPCGYIAPPQALPILFVGRGALTPPFAGTHNNGPPADIDMRLTNNLTVSLGTKPT